jgi:hypothetical protein
VDAPPFPGEGDLAGPDARAELEVVAPDLLREFAFGSVLVGFSVVEATARGHPERIAERRFEPQQQHLRFEGEDEQTRGSPRNVFHDGGPGRI